MRRSIIVAAVVVATALAGMLAAGAMGRTRQPALPAVDRFAAGACRDAAEAVRSLAPLARRASATSLSTADRAEIRRLQDRFVAVAPGAAANVRAPMQDLIVALGYLRIRLDSRTAEPRYLQQVEEARARVERICVTPSPVRS